VTTSAAADDLLYMARHRRSQYHWERLVSRTLLSLGHARK